MSALSRNSAKLSVGALAAMSALAFGAGTAGANPNDPGMDRVGGDGTVSSRQAASTSSPKHCEIGIGTLNTASTIGHDVGTPMQRANEAGPDWVGSDGWQAIGLSRSNPWGGSFNPQSTRTGPQCRTGNANGF